MRIYSVGRNYRYGFTLPNTALTAPGTLTRWYSNPTARDMALATARDASLAAGLPLASVLAMVAIDEVTPTTGRP